MLLLSIIGSFAFGDSFFFFFFGDKNIFRCVPSCPWVIETPLFRDTFRKKCRLSEKNCYDKFASLFSSVRAFDYRPTCVKMQSLLENVIF